MPKPTFEQRFDLSIDSRESRRRFAARARNLIFDHFVYSGAGGGSRRLERNAVSALGEVYYEHKSIADYVKGDFLKTLRAIESLAESVENEPYGSRRREFESLVLSLLSEAEIDLGVRWERGRFYAAGAPSLDQALVNDSLTWLRRHRLKNVEGPYEKALQHLLVARQRPELLADVITDCYEALEALAKHVTERNRDLAGNREKFISLLGAPAQFSRVLKELIAFANEYRHATDETEGRQPPAYGEAEAFVYFAGIFMRLALVDQHEPSA